MGARGDLDRHPLVTAQRHPALSGLLPGEEVLAGDGQGVDLPTLAVADRAPHDLQEPNAGLDRGCGGRFAVGLQQALAFDPPAVVGVARLTPAPRKHAAERPPLLVLGRRATVGPQQVALIQNRLRDGFNRVGGHRCGSGTSSEAIVRSQSGAPTRRR